MEERRRFNYRIATPDGGSTDIAVVIEPDTFECSEPPAVALPWTALDYLRCPGCPLADDQPLCPMAAHLAPVVEKIGGLLSFEEVDVTVQWGSRQLQGRTPAQRVAMSLIGLVVATSGCPRSAFLRPMAWFHLPFATEEETIFRAVSSYLLVQYFVAGRGRQPDWSLEGLSRRYAELHEVNVAMAQRLREACKHDAIVNAVVLLDLFAKAVPFSVQESLESLQPLFAGKPD